MTIKITQKDVIIFILWIVSMLVVYISAVNAAVHEANIDAGVLVRSHEYKHHRK